MVRVMGVFRKGPVMLTGIGLHGRGRGNLELLDFGQISRLPRVLVLLPLAPITPLTLLPCRSETQSISTPQESSPPRANVQSRLPGTHHHSGW
jgi:hypothetical protein